MLIRNASIIHNDRKTLSKFIKHQIEWGKHHYHLRYKKILFNNNKFYLIIFFLFLYPVIIFLLNFLMTIATLIPWVKKKLYIFFVFFFQFLLFIFY